jgi:hypothetical protein
MRCWSPGVAVVELLPQAKVVQAALVLVECLSQLARLSRTYH